LILAPVVAYAITVCCFSTLVGFLIVIELIVGGFYGLSVLLYSAVGYGSTDLRLDISTELKKI
jgi:hypothetical protein